MELNVKPVAAFKELPTAKKAAVIGGTVAATALVATGIAYGKGKKNIIADKFEGKLPDGQKIKAKEAIVEGYKAIGHAIASIPDKIKGLFKKGDKAEGAEK